MNADDIEVLHDTDAGLITLKQDDDKIFLNEDYTKNLIKQLQTILKEKK
jgi:hypothetical protein